MDELITVLPFVLPPLLGAVIGYVTNALAIRMLFRPLTEKRVLGIRVPLTPGIIPRQRQQLAHSIARMVSTRLLTEDVLVDRLHDPRFEEALEASVGRFTSDILEGSAVAGGAAAGRNAPGEEAADGEVRTALADAAGSVLGAFFRSDLFAEVVHRVAETVTTGALAMETGRVVPSSERLGALVDDAVRSLAGGPAAPAAEHAVQRWVASHLERDTPLVEIVGERSIERLAGTVPGVYEPALDALVAFLREPATRRELSVHGRELLKRILQRLNLFQRFLVSATQYDRTLSESMPGIVDDVIASVDRAGHDPENRDRLIGALQTELRSLGRTGMRTLLERFDLHADRLVTRVFALAVELLGRDDVRRRIAGGVVRFADAHRDRSLGAVVHDLFGQEPEQISARIVEMADRWIARPENVDRLSERAIELAMRFLAREERRPLGHLLPVSPEQKARIDRFLTARLQTLVSRRVPEVIAGLDVYTMVVEKIEALDMESVEQLLLMVIARHLKWINLFGALLGSLIGGVQVVIGLVT
ncbi:MAG: DUF445 family protein [Spirochaetota bacterium]